MGDNVNDGVEARGSQIHGNGLFTKRAFEAGDVLASVDRPLIVTLTTAIEEACSWCLALAHEGMEWPSPGTPVSADVPLTPCAVCQSVKYCSETCKAAHWEAVHKTECEEMRAHGIPEYAVRATLQVLHGLEREDAAFKKFLDRKSDFVAIRQRGGRKWRDIVKLAQEAFDLAAPRTKSDLEVAQRAMCLVLHNDIPIHSHRFEPLGEMHDPLFSDLNHSCDPNAFIVSDGPKATLRALKPLDADQEIFISYINKNICSDSDIFDIRRMGLKERFAFQCKCSKCALGRDGPPDAWLRPVEEMFQEGRVVSDLFIPFVYGPVNHADPPRPAGHSRPTRRAAAIEWWGYFTLMMADSDDEGTQAVEWLRSAITTLIGSGLFAKSRAPIPNLYNRLEHACRQVRNAEQRLMVCMRIHFEIDPVLFPQQHHPKRVAHTWHLFCAALTLVTDHETEVDCNGLISELEPRGIGMVLMMAGLLMELRENVPKSFGENSKLMTAVTRHWDDVVTGQRQVLKISEREVYALFERNVPAVLSKADGFARSIRVTDGGLVIPSLETLLGELLDLDARLLSLYSQSSAAEEADAEWEDVMD